MISLKKSYVKKINTRRLFYFYFKNYIISRLKKRDLPVKAHIFKITGGLKGN